MLKFLLFLLAFSFSQGELRTVYHVGHQINNLTGRHDDKILTVEKYSDLLILKTKEGNYNFDITSYKLKPNSGISYILGDNQGRVDILNKNDGKHIYFHYKEEPVIDADMFVTSVKMGY